MTVTNLTTPKCTMGDGLDKLGHAGDALDSGRYTLAFLLEVMQADYGSTHAIQCVILTLPCRRIRWPWISRVSPSMTLAGPVTSARAGVASRHRAMVSARMDLACHTLPLRSGIAV